MNFNKFLDESIRSHSDPANFSLHVVGISLGVYGLWIHNIAFMFFGFLVLPLIGGIYAFSDKKTMNYWLLSHKHPVNFLSHIVAYMFLFYGLWWHSWTHAALGIIFMAVSHLYVKTLKH